jgi:hypothetical protein
VSSSNSVANSGLVGNILTGNTHAIYGTFAVGVAGAILVCLGWKGSNPVILAIGVLLVLLSAGLFVDLWNEGFTH